MAQGMKTYNLLLLPGDGIGPEVMGEVERIVGWIDARGLATINTETDLVGGAAYDAHGVPITDAAMARAARFDSRGSSVTHHKKAWVSSSSAINGNR